MEEMSYLGFSSKWSANLARRHHLDEEKQAVLAYIIEVLVINVVNVLLALLLGWALGVFWNTTVCLLTIAAFRHNAGGGHSESPWRCGLATIAVFPLLALAASHISTGPQLYLDLLSLAALLIGFTSIMHYAPVDNSKAPVVSPVRRKRLKSLALVIMVIITVLIGNLRLSTWDKSVEISACLALSSLWAAFNLTPLGHRMWCFIDSIRIRKGRGCIN